MSGSSLQLALRFRRHMQSCRLRFRASRTRCLCILQPSQTLVSRRRIGSCQWLFVVVRASLIVLSFLLVRSGYFLKVGLKVYIESNFHSIFLKNLTISLSTLLFRFVYPFFCRTLSRSRADWLNLSKIVRACLRLMALERLSSRVAREHSCVRNIPSSHAFIFQQSIRTAQTI